MDQDFPRPGFHILHRLFGGYEFDYPTFYRTMLQVARGNPGVAWCLALGATHGSLIASHWPERAQYELFGSTGDFIAPHRVGAITSSCERAEGGYVVDGIWNYCSGIPYATHFVGNVVLRENDKSRILIFVMPRAQLRMLDDWGGDATLGMRASGSNSVEIKKTFIPEHLVIPAKPALWANEPMDDGTARGCIAAMYLSRSGYHMAGVRCRLQRALDGFEEHVVTQPTYHPPIMPRRERFVSVPGLCADARPLGRALLMTRPGPTRIVGGRRRPRSTRATRALGMVLTAGRLASGGRLSLPNATRPPASVASGWSLFRDVAMYRQHMSAQYLNIASGIGRVHLGLPFGWGGL